MIAVITGDLVNSSLYEEELLNKVLDALQQAFEEIQNTYGAENVRFSIFRGDSFQGIVYDPKKALRMALLIKATVNRVHFKEVKKSKTYSKVADFRMAIGIGTFDFERDSVSESNGQAFQFSGRTLDEMKTETQRTKIKSPFQEINEEFNTSFFLLDQLMEKWTTASAEVVYYLLKGLKEREIAEQLDISQSAVNQRKKASGWEAISSLVIRYEDVIAKRNLNE